MKHKTPKRMMVLVALVISILCSNMQALATDGSVNSFYEIKGGNYSISPAEGSTTQNPTNPTSGTGRKRVAAPKQVEEVEEIPSLMSIEESELVQLIHEKEGEDVDLSNLSTDTLDIYVTTSRTWEMRSGVRKGTCQDKQPLMQELMPGEWFYIRQVGEDVGKYDLYFEKYTGTETGSVMGEDGNHKIPKDGSWVAFQAQQIEYDYDGETVPTTFFVSSPNVDTVGNDFHPTVEFRTDHTTKCVMLEREADMTQSLWVGTEKRTNVADIDYFNAWRESGSQFSFLRCRTVLILNHLCSFNSMGFATFKDLFDYYDALCDQYDNFAGLSNEPGTPVYHTRSNTRYVLGGYRSKTAIGAAYWAGGFIFQGGTLGGPGWLSNGWLSTHEMGHGYDQFFGALSTGEAWNNVLGHYFQEYYNGYCSWSNFHKPEVVKPVAESIMAGGMLPASGPRERLFFMVNLFDKVGPQRAISYMYSKYRESLYFNQPMKDQGTYDWWVRCIASATGYNAIPYFEAYQCDIKQATKDELFRENLYQNVYPLLYLFLDKYHVDSDNQMVRDDGSVISAEEKTTAENKALEALETLQLGDMFDLVDTAQMQTLGYNGQVTINIDQKMSQEMAGQSICLTDGVHTLKEIPVVSNTTLYQVSIPIGVYNVVLPSSGNYSFDLEKKTDYIVVRDEKNVTLNFGSTELNADFFANHTLAWKGQYGWFLYVYYDAENGTINIKPTGANAHSYWGLDSVYGSAELLNKSGRTIHSVSITHHSEGVETGDHIFPVEKGYRLKVYHAEGQNGAGRFKAAPSALHFDATTFTLMPNGQAKELEFEVTDYGLRLVSPEEKSVSAEEIQEIYYETVCAYMDQLIAENPYSSFKDDRKLTSEKAHINQAFGERFSEQQKAAFLEKYPRYYPFANSVFTLEIGDIEEQYYTGEAIEPSLTVTCDGEVLTEEQYVAVYSRNVEKGIAKVVVSALGEYEGAMAEKQFQIIAPVVTDFTVTAEVSEVPYTGSPQVPDVVVTAVVNGEQKTLVRGLDYNTRYTNNNQVGTATIEAIGRENYEGQYAETTFRIVGQIIPLTVELNGPKFVYMGEDRVPTVVTVKDATKVPAKTLMLDRDYRLEYVNNNKPGTATVKAIGIGNYDGSEGNAQYTLKAFVEPDDLDLDPALNSRIQIRGWSGWAGSMNFDATTGNLKWQQGGYVHSYYTSSPYYEVFVRDQDGYELYHVSHLGNAPGFNVDYKLGLGYEIEFRSAELRDVRSYYTRLYQNNPIEELNQPFDQHTEYFRVTEYGLVPADMEEADLQNEMKSLIEKYQKALEDDLDAQIDNPEEKREILDDGTEYIDWKGRIESLFEMLSQEDKIDFLENHFNTFPFDGRRVILVNIEGHGTTGIEPFTIVPLGSVQNITITPDSAFYLKSYSVNDKQTEFEDPEDNSSRVCAITEIEQNIRLNVVFETLQEHVHRIEETRQEPTCSEEGFVTYQCTSCKLYFTNKAGTTETQEERQILKKVPHTYTNHYSKNETSHYLICDVCENDMDSIRENHTWEEDTEKTSKTEIFYRCNTCQGTKTEVRKHVHTIEVDRKSPTCAEEGSIAYICRECNTYFVNENGDREADGPVVILEKLNHSPGNSYDIEKDVHHRLCKDCGQRLTREAHRFAESKELSSETEKVFICKDCGTSYSTKVEKPSTEEGDNGSSPGDSGNTGTGENTSGGNTDSGNTGGGTTPGGNTTGGNSNESNTGSSNHEGSSTNTPGGNNTTGGNTSSGNTTGGNNTGGSTDSGNSNSGNNAGSSSGEGNTENTTGNTPTGGNSNTGTTEDKNTDSGNTSGGDTNSGNNSGGSISGGSNTGGNITGGNTQSGSGTNSENTGSGSTNSGNTTGNTTTGSTTTGSGTTTGGSTESSKPSSGTTTKPTGGTTTGNNTASNGSGSNNNTSGGSASSGSTNGNSTGTSSSGNVVTITTNSTGTSGNTVTSTIKGNSTTAAKSTTTTTASANKSTGAISSSSSSSGTTPTKKTGATNTTKNNVAKKSEEETEDKKEENNDIQTLSENSLEKKEETFAEKVTEITPEELVAEETVEPILLEEGSSESFMDMIFSGNIDGVIKTLTENKEMLIIPAAVLLLVILLVVLVVVKIKKKKENE